MGTNYFAVSTKPTVCHPIHIGKSSAGWKFLFHRVDIWDNYFSNDALNTFPQWKKFLEKQTSNGNIVIMNEYDKVVPLDEFLALVERKQSENNPDDFTYADNIDGYRFTNGEFS